MHNLWQVFLMFIKVSLLTTSGPASVGLLYKEAVGKLMGESQLVEAVGFSSVSPGSDALQLAMFVGYSAGGMAYTIRLAKANGARLTTLHIVEPVTLDYSLTREMHDHWSELIETFTPQARHFIKSIAAAKEAGVEARLLARHGQVVQVIIQEARSANYDRIGLGSAHSSRSLRGLSRQDVSPLASAAVDCPILTIRGKADDTFEQDF